MQTLYYNGGYSQGGDFGLMSYGATLDSLRKEGNFRSIPAADTDAGVVNLSLNDYLGLAARTDLQERFFADEANRRIAMTASAARLLASDQNEYARLESYISSLYGGRPALLFNSGYHANTGLISALASEGGTLIVADKLIHASAIDGIMLSKAPFKRFLTNDFNRLESILRKEHDAYERIIVIVESVYSMDGDRTDLDALVELKRRYPNVLLYIDEAHSFGTLGHRGLGLSRWHEGFEEIDVVMCTLGKAGASAGAFAVLSPELRDYAVNRSRSFIFSTAIAPLTAAWSRYTIECLTGMDAERAHLQRLSRRLAEGVGAAEPRYIMPYLTGGAEAALRLSARLLERGYKVLPIRTPTVPPGTERLRISLSAALTEAQIKGFTDTLRECAAQF